MFSDPSMMQRLRHAFVWLKRIGRCRGFGIQSPTDYWIVRYVINEHWPYYQYATLGKDDEWITRKMGFLYFRLANWLQPHIIESNGFRQYLQAGCQKAEFGESSELIRLTLEGDYRARMAAIFNRVESHSVLVVEAIRTNRAFWREILADERTGVTFDLYYCGIVMFDKKRQKHHYIINF